MRARILLAAALLLVCGCAAWTSKNLDLSRYRDPRAADIDSRLSSPGPPSAKAFTE